MLINNHVLAGLTLLPAAAFARGDLVKKHENECPQLVSTSCLLSTTVFVTVTADSNGAVHTIGSMPELAHPGSDVGAASGTGSNEWSKAQNEAGHTGGLGSTSNGASTHQGSPDNRHPGNNGGPGTHSGEGSNSGYPGSPNGNEHGSGSHNGGSPGPDSNGNGEFHNGGPHNGGSHNGGSHNGGSHNEGSHNGGSQNGGSHPDGSNDNSQHNSSSTTTHTRSYFSYSNSTSSLPHGKPNPASKTYSESASEANTRSSTSLSTAQADDTHTSASGGSPSGSTNPSHGTAQSNSLSQVGQSQSTRSSGTAANPHQSSGPAAGTGSVHASGVSAHASGTGSVLHGVSGTGSSSHGPAGTSASSHAAASGTGQASHGLSGTGSFSHGPVGTSASSRAVASGTGVSSHSAGTGPASVRGTSYNNPSASASQGTAPYASGRTSLGTVAHGTSVSGSVRPSGSGASSVRPSGSVRPSVSGRPSGFSPSSGFVRPSGSSGPSGSVRPSGSGGLSGSVRPTGTDGFSASPSASSSNVPPAPKTCTITNGATVTQGTCGPNRCLRRRGDIEAGCDDNENCCPNEETPDPTPKTCTITSGDTTTEGTCKPLGSCTLTKRLISESDGCDLTEECCPNEETPDPTPQPCTFYTATDEDETPVQRDGFCTPESACQGAGVVSSTYGCTSPQICCAPVTPDPTPKQCTVPVIHGTDLTLVSGTCKTTGTCGEGQLSRANSACAPTEECCYTEPTPDPKPQTCTGLNGLGVGQGTCKDATACTNSELTAATGCEGDQVCCSNETPDPTPETCTSGGVGGTCQLPTDCTASDKTTTSDLCGEGPKTCCIPKAADPPPPTCGFYGTVFNCKDATACSESSGLSLPGLCPASETGQDQCCIPVGFGTRCDNGDGICVQNPDCNRDLGKCRGNDLCADDELCFTPGTPDPPEPVACEVRGTAGTCQASDLACTLIDGFFSDQSCPDVPGTMCCTGELPPDPAPGPGDACSAPGVGDGTCKAATECASDSNSLVADICNGEPLTCCVPKPQPQTCEFNGQAGTCITNAACNDIPNAGNSGLQDGICGNDGSVDAVCCTPPPSSEGQSCSFNGQEGTCTNAGSCTGTLGATCSDGISTCCIPEPAGPIRFKLHFHRDPFDEETLGRCNNDRKLKLAKRAAAGGEGYVRITQDSGSAVLEVIDQYPAVVADIFELTDDGLLKPSYSLDGFNSALRPAYPSNINEKFRFLADDDPNKALITCARTDGGDELRCNSYEKGTLYACDIDNILRLSAGNQDQCQCTGVQLTVVEV